MRHRAFIILFFALISIDNFSQQANNFTKKDGLSSNLVNSIKIDKQNNIWFCTDSGITKYDGTKWTSFYKSNGLPSNRIEFVDFDNKNNAWFVSVRGITKYDGKEFKTYIPPSEMRTQIVEVNLPFTDSISDTNNIRKILIEDIDTTKDENTSEDFVDHHGKWDSTKIEICSIMIDKNYIIWIGTMGEGIYNFNGQTWTKIKEPEYDSFSFAYSMAQDKFGNIWIGTSNGIYTSIKNNWKHYSFNDGLVDKWIYSIAIDSNNVKYFGTSRGIISVFNDKKWSEIQLPGDTLTNQVTSIVVDSQNNKLVVCDWGVFKVNNKDIFDFIPKEMKNKYRITNIAIDKYDYIWLSTDVLDCNYKNDFGVYRIKNTNR
ncbi:MAG: two-component regulator propeller domain-containing protein [Bacteroidales bacterium]|jgi:ligand-binding sensor domain-containing protein